MDAKSNRLKLKKAWLLWAAMPFLLSAFRCGDDEQVEYVEMAFMLPFNMGPSPGKLINGTDMKKGDTLWLEADFSDSLLEFHSKRKYKIENIDFGMALALFEFKYPDLVILQQRSATIDFDFEVRTGSIPYYSESFADIAFKYDDREGRYKFKVGLVAKRTGIFFFFFATPGYEYANRDMSKYVNLGRNQKGERIVPVYENFLLTVNDGGDNNYELAKRTLPNAAIYESYDPNVRYNDYYNVVKGSYTIRVIE